MNAAADSRFHGDDPEAAASVRAAADLRDRAFVLTRTGRAAEAVTLLRQALRTLAVTSGQPESIAMRTRVLATLAYAQAETGLVVDGLAHLGTASDLVSALPDGPLRTALHGLVTSQHALVMLRQGRYAESLPLFDETIALLQQTESTPARDTELFAAAFMNRGLAYIALGKPGPAERDMRTCIELAEAADLHQVAAKARGNLGDIALLVGDIPGALRHYEDAVRVFRTIAPGLVPRGQIDQARALLAAGLAEEAARHLDEAIPVLREHRISQDLAEAELVRAAAALLAGELTLAKQLAGSAHRRFVKRGSEPWAEVAALTRMQAETIAALNGQPSNATPGKAAKLADRLGDLGLTDEAAKAILLAVRLALRRGSAKTAELLLMQAPPPSKITPIDHRMLLRLGRAELALAKGDRRRAMAEASAGLTELSRVRDRMGGLDLVCGTAVHGRELGRLAMRVVLDRAATQADARRLLSWQERTRAQIYRYEPLPTIDDPVLAGKVAELRSMLRTVQQARLERRPTGSLEQRAAALQREVSRLGWYTSKWGRPRPVSSPAEISEVLGERALVSFAGPGDDLAAVVVTGGRFHLFRLGTKEDVLETARQLHADLDALAPDELVAPLAAAVSASARHRLARLEQVLLGPFAGLLEDRELVVVPFGGLYSVPWGSLPVLCGRAISVAPSATAWVNAETARRNGRRRVVLVGGPGLPYSVSELTRLREIYPDATVLEGEAATTEAVLSAMDGAYLVHIAAHGTHEPANALFSRLELADGGLLAHELARLRRPPQHVVLAACELALSHIRPGDEALGFADALLATGSRTVIAALSRVGDRTAAETMTAFHRRLTAGPESANDLADTMADYHRRIASGTLPAAALAEATAADPLRRPFICLGAG